MSGGCDNVCSQGGCVHVDCARIIMSFEARRWSASEHLSAMWHHIQGHNVFGLFLETSNPQEHAEHTWYNVHVLFVHNVQFTIMNYAGDDLLPKKSVVG